MKIRLIEADELKIRQLEENSAFAWEGMTLDPENIDAIADVFVEKQLVLAQTEELIGYIWYGCTMNSLYNLHNDNQYPDDLPFLCFDRKSFNGSGNLNAFKMMVGVRWLDDIVANNAVRERM